MELLLGADKLIFTEEDLFYGEIIRCRNARVFEQRYLNVRMDFRLTVIRILDSRRENFKLNKGYDNKVEVVNVITSPEIEMLIILNENKYREFRKSGRKPSEFCKEKLKMKDVKSSGFVKKYFDNPEVLIASIIKYHEISKIRKDEFTLLDLLK